VGRLFVVLVLIAAALHGWVEGHVIIGQFHRQETPLAFISKFCFSDKGLGQTMFTASHILNDTDLKLLTFDDDVWDQVYDKGLSCEQIREVIARSGNSARMDPIVENQPITHSFEDNARPRYWFFAVSRCQPGPVNFHFRFEMTNPGGYWEKQFSFEYQGLGQTYLAFFIVYLFFNLLVVVALVYKWRTNSFGTITSLFQLWFALMLLEMCGKFFMFLHEAIYADDGIGAPGVRGFGDMLEMSSRVLFVGLLLLMAAGFTLTTYQLPNRVLLITLGCLWSLSYVALYIWENIEEDDIEIRTTFESAPGIINLIFRGLIWLFFGFTIYQHIQRIEILDEDTVEPALPVVSKGLKIRFYVPFSILISIWFLILPFMVIISQSYASYYRFKSIMAVVYPINFFIEILVGIWLFLPRDGLELTNGRGIFFGLLPNRARSSLLSSSGSNSHDGARELKYLSDDTVRDNARAFLSHYDVL